jgi:hypothetical protein
MPAGMSLSLLRPARSERGLGGHGPRQILVGTDDQEQARWIHAGSTSFASGGSPEVLLGLGDATEIAYLLVRWPDGGSSAFTEIPVNQVVTISAS